MVNCYAMQNERLKITIFELAPHNSMWRNFPTTLGIMGGLG